MPAPMHPSDAAIEYPRRLADRTAQVAALVRSDRGYANARLAAVAAACAALWAAWGLGLFDPWVALAPAAAFVVLAVRHDRVLRRLDRAALAAAFYAGGVARLEGTWPGRGRRGDRYADPAHAFSSDLDLFGRGSLFELLCTAATRPGEDCLARWLLQPAPPSDIRARQAAVVELRDRLDLREELAVVGGQVAEDVDPDALVEWGAEALPPAGWWAQASAGLVGAVGLVGAALWLAGHGVATLGATAAAGLAVSWALRRRVRDTLEGVDRSARGLTGVARALAVLEGETFASPLLVDLHRTLVADGRSAAAAIGRLGRRIDALHGGANPLLAPLAALVLWRLQCALAIERWRATHGRHVDGWLQALGALEALCSLARHAYERPDHVFPSLEEDGARVDAVAVAHPLLGPAAIPNDVRLDDERRVLLVSGSNMSGKSTLLRAVGVNVVLAQAGAPVRAGSMRLSPLQVATAMRTADSLQSGTSHFYAEITRLKLVTDLAADAPTLFLLDEILHGTNSRDRLVGAAAVVRALVRRGAIGLVTTHDLALAQLVEEAEVRGANVHFEDHVADGRMAFDYVLRPGVVERGNALDLMRAVGLEV